MVREYKRAQRVGSQLQRELAELIRGQIQDPRLGWVTVDDVEVSRDLAVARVYVSTLEREQTEPSLAALRSAAPFLRRELARRLHLRAIPQLRFLQDTAIERGMRIDQLLEEIAKRRQETDE